MSKKGILTSAIFIFLLVIGSIALYIFFKPHRSIDSEATVSVSSDSLLAAYARDEVSANAAYLDKVLVVTGEISELNTNQDAQTVIILKTVDPISGVVCTIKEKPSISVQIGQHVTIKGFCSGFISDVVMRDCQVISK